MNRTPSNLKQIFSDRLIRRSFQWEWNGKLAFRLCVFLFLFLSSSTVSAQALLKRIANNSFERHRIERAAFFYECAYDKDTTNVEVLRQLARCYYHLGLKEEEISSRLAIGRQSYLTSIDKYALSQLYREIGEYEKGQKWLKEFAADEKNHPVIHKENKKYKAIETLMEEKNDFDVRFLNINTTQEQSCPTFYDENTLLFAQSLDQHGETRQSSIHVSPQLLTIVSAQIEDVATLSWPDEFAKFLSTQAFDGPVGVSPDKKILYLTETTIKIPEETKKRKKRRSRHTDLIGLAIRKYKYEGDQWIYKGTIDFGDEQSSYGHACLSPDGQKIFFISDREGSYGGTDIWYANKEEEGWGEPQNLGPKINTEADELFPFIDQENNLYFSSNGHPGFGRFDNYIAAEEDGRYFKPQNLGNSINSAYDDLSFIYSNAKQEGYFSSNRRNKKGLNDLYFARRKSLKCYNLGNLYDTDTERMILYGKISIIDEQGKVLETQELTGNKPYNFEIHTGEQYTLLAEKEGFQPQSITIDCVGKKPYERSIIDIYLIPKKEYKPKEKSNPIKLPVLEEEPEFHLPYVQFAFNSTQLLNSEKKKIDQIASFLNHHPDKHIVIETHADLLGSKKMNKMMAEKRAYRIYTYIKPKLKNLKQVRTVSYGDVKPKIRMQGPPGLWPRHYHKINRRANFKVFDENGQLLVDNK